eukprot:5264094-Alexandrium_andersonii.AAC.1
MQRLAALARAVFVVPVLLLLSSAQASAARTFGWTVSPARMGVLGRRPGATAARSIAGLVLPTASPCLLYTSPSPRD